MGKITIKHYLNKRLKQKNGCYPVYVKVTYKRKNTNFKSTFLYSLYENEFDNDQVIQKLKYTEVNLIEFIVKIGIRINSNFNITDIPISEIVNFWGGSLVNKFHLFFLDTDTIMTPIISFLSEKSGILFDDLKHFFISRPELNEILNIKEYGIYDSRTLDLITYYELLIAFEELHYPEYDNTVIEKLSIVRGNHLNVFEWFSDNIHHKFVKYSMSHSQLSKEKILDISEKFNDKIERTFIWQFRNTENANNYG